MSRNDLAHLIMEQGDFPRARAGDRRGLRHRGDASRRATGSRSRVLNCTRSEIRLRAGRAAEALADAERAADLLSSTGDPNPYLLAMIVVIEVQALLALGRLDEAARCGQRTVSRLGERVPQARSLILSTVAAALREAGRTEQAYDVLSHSAEVERRAFQELSELQRGLERATLETVAARDQSDALAAKNRELERRRARARRRTRGARAADRPARDTQVQLREQADRDWLTGLHNRRYLAREVDRHAAAPGAGPFSLAVLDLDDFKGINDRFGHQAGDRVLMRVAALLLGELRGQDVVVRTGGEEFVLLMPHTEAGAAAACCERLRNTIRDEPWDRIAPGHAAHGQRRRSPPRTTRATCVALAELADNRLFEAKRSGRDRVVVV